MSGTPPHRTHPSPHHPAPPPPPPAAKPPPVVRAPRGEPENPTTAALLEMLRLLNQAERFDDDREKGLELEEIVQLFSDHWSVDKAGVKPAVVLGLLLRNKMVDRVEGTVRSWTRQRDFGPHYRINGAGKMFLSQTLHDRDRITTSGRI